MASEGGEPARSCADSSDRSRFFANAAHLARYAGFKGISLDLEEHQGLWTSDPMMPDKGDRLYLLGKEIGDAIKGQFPAATLIVMPEVVMQSRNPRSAQARKDFELSDRFWTDWCARIS